MVIVKILVQIYNIISPVLVEMSLWPRYLTNMNNLFEKFLQHLEKKLKKILGTFTKNFKNDQNLENDGQHFLNIWTFKISRILDEMSKMGVKIVSVASSNFGRKVENLIKLLNIISEFWSECRKFRIKFRIYKIIDFWQKQVEEKTDFGEGRVWFRILISNEIFRILTKIFSKFDTVSGKIVEVMTNMFKKLTKLFNKFGQNSNQIWTKFSGFWTKYFQKFDQVSS